MRSVKCPTCRTPVPWQGNPYRPFCSARCRILDLGAWADESYRLPGGPLPEETDESARTDTAAEDRRARGEDGKRSAS
ncbi:MAG: DNA gyrase inhibitor YacG [Deltaproteobacteria bacterium]|nr:DNA gyrase inhibitor YacG [Deltaproteobacteria bacterium]